MAILVDFLAGNGAKIIAALAHGEYSALESRTVCTGRVGFSLTCDPGQAMDALIGAASQIRGVEPFAFRSCLPMNWDHQAEQFQALLHARFVDLFHGFPKTGIQRLAELWLDACRVLAEDDAEHGSSRQAGKRDSLSVGQRAANLATRAAFTVVVYPMLAGCMLIPRLGGQRRKNREQRLRQETKPLPTVPELLQQLADLCEESSRESRDLVFAWSL